LFGTSEDNNGESLTTVIDEQRFMVARNILVREGIPVQKAESNLRRLAQAIVVSTNQRIDGLLELAEKLDQDGEWGKSLALYKQIISSLPSGDERLDLAKHLLTDLQTRCALPAEGKTG
jgi:hypothetical protein